VSCCPDALLASRTPAAIRWKRSKNVMSRRLRLVDLVDSVDPVDPVDLSEWKLAGFSEI
jgi:hypothetical protein